MDSQQEAPRSARSRSSSTLLRSNNADNWLIIVSVIMFCRNYPQKNAEAIEFGLHSRSYILDDASPNCGALAVLPRFGVSMVAVTMRALQSCSALFVPSL